MSQVQLQMMSMSAMPGLGKVCNMMGQENYLAMHTRCACHASTCWPAGPALTLSLTHSPALASD
jgi:hypothetical protein